MKRKGLRQLIVYVLLLSLLTGCGIGSGAGTSQHSRPSLDSEMSGNSERSERSERSSMTQDSSDRAQSVKNEPMTLAINGVDYEGTFTGMLQGGLPEGSGSFSAGEFVFNGRFAEGKITDGSLTNFPLKIMVGETEMSGIYSGEVKDGMVTGKGSFDADPFTYRGSFTEGVPTGEGQVTALPMSQKLAGQTYSGFYKGTVRNLMADGEGTFEAGSVKYEGSFSAGLPTGGTLTNCPMTVDFNGNAISGKYTGTMLDGAIAGEGTLTSNDFTYVGTFAANAPTGTGEVTGYAFTVVFQGNSFSGVYEGAIDAFLPEGTGKFETAANTEGIYLTFEGTFSAGRPWDGEINTNRCTINLVSTTDSLLPHTGIYQGGLAGGLPNGTGRFEAVGEEHDYEYTGNFHDGKPNGWMTYTYHVPEGDLVWEKERVEGKMIWHSSVDYLADFIVSESTRYSLQTFYFVKDHQAAFNGLTNDAALKGMANNSVTFDMIFNNVSDYYETIVKFTNYWIYDYEITNWRGTELDYLSITAISENQGDHVLWITIVAPHGSFDGVQFEDEQVITVWGVPTSAESDDRENANYHYVSIFAFAIE